MRTLTKNNNIIFALVVLLILSIMFITGCNNDITVEKPYTPPQGMGAIKLNLNKNIARTILPDDITDVTNFDHFDLLFIFDDSTPGGNALTKRTIAQGEQDDPIPLAFGNYSLTVLAFLKAGDSDEAASWQSNPTIGYSIHITSPTTPEPVTVDLRGNTKTGTGTFDWDIDTSNITGTVKIVDMTLTKIGGSTTIYDLLKGTGTGTLGTVSTKGLKDSLSLASGYYTVIFKLSVDSIVINFQQILHIYANMTSYFTYEFTNNYFGIVSGSIEMTLDYANRGTPITLLNGVTPLPEEGNVGPLTIGTDLATIKVSNASSFTGSINWYCSDSSMILVKNTTVITDDTLTIIPTSAANNFNIAKTYIITATGTNTAGEPSSIFFYVNVVEP